MARWAKKTDFSVQGSVHELSGTLIWAIRRLNRCSRCLLGLEGEISQLGEVESMPVSASFMGALVL